MGNVDSIIREQHIESEFERVSKKASNSNNNGSNFNSNSGGIEYLTVDEAKKLQSLENYPIDFRRLAVLFMLDVDKNGKFSMDDLIKFSHWCVQVTSPNMNNNNNSANVATAAGGAHAENNQMGGATGGKLSLGLASLLDISNQSSSNQWIDQQSFKSEIQAQCTLHMWKQISSENGKQAFSDWFVRLFSAGMVVRVNQLHQLRQKKQEENEKRRLMRSRQNRRGSRIEASLPSEDKTSARSTDSEMSSTRSSVTCSEDDDDYSYADDDEEDLHEDHEEEDKNEEELGEESAAAHQAAVSEEEEAKLKEATESSKNSPKYQSSFISTDTVSTLHEILCIQELYGISCQALIDVMQRVGEELGMMGLDDEDLDDVIPAKIVHLFAENFSSGFCNMMNQLGFDKYLASSCKI